MEKGYKKGVSAEEEGGSRTQQRKTRVQGYKEVGFRT